MSPSFDRLLRVMSRLRGEGGCPWDREQTHVSLKPYLVEETYEVIEAIESGCAEPLCEELGDLLFQVVFHAEIAKEAGRFDMDSILKACIEKMTHRHPHVFSEKEANTHPADSEAVLERWEEIKKKESRNRHRESALDGVPKSLPSLLRAYQLQARTARVGFDWQHPEPVLDKIDEEFEELREAMANKDPNQIENELGDLLFSIVNLARHMKINPEDAMRGTINRFTERFSKLEKKAKEDETDISSLSLDEMNLLWDWAKSDANL
ncbi:MAG: nucleoside triphosphate pyrophosphohydrolase [Nitrospiria bacterium]